MWCGLLASQGVSGGSTLLVMHRVWGGAGGFAATSGGWHCAARVVLLLTRARSATQYFRFFGSASACGAQPWPWRD